MMKQLLVASICALAAACGGGDGGGGGGTTITGTVGGVDVRSPKDVASFAFNTACTNGSVSVIAVAVSDLAGLCSAVQASKDLKSQQSLTLAVVRAAGTGTATPLGAGTYTVKAAPTTEASGSMLMAQANLSKTDASCKATVDLDATSGTITITSIAGNAISGSFNLTFASGTMSGTFAASGCAVPTSLQGAFCGGTQTNTCG